MFFSETIAGSFRKCNKCFSEKPLSEFHADKTLLFGRRYTCKQCAMFATRTSVGKRQRESGGLFSVWASMKQRCLDQSHHSYNRYGGRGISVCSEWITSLNAFTTWANANGFKLGLQLDRIDNDGDYSPSNCQWLTPKENSRKSTATKLNADSVKQIRDLRENGMRQQELALMFGVTQSSISNICRGKSWF